ncbi:hypothetical protein M9H77_19873 [Catharanthus roseus]|uniref:Uncharacterized protein n=1 Tax=Catharanthus roseus TaxID=4058 RepID=A0ACC0BBJ6_CATRO|nr:hypothetical protein M9H77_19873 [Catharanthus roseus]
MKEKQKLDHKELAQAARYSAGWTMKHCLDRDDEEEYHYGATHIDVLQVALNIGGGEWTRAKSLGDKSIFIGHNTSFFVNASKLNCIYFTDIMKKPT